MSKARPMVTPVVKLTQAQIYAIIRSPVITEKATLMSSTARSPSACRSRRTKPEIKAAVETLFKVKVTAVNTLRQEGKKKVFRGRRGQRSDYKKAMVTLAEGHTIDVTTGV